MTDDSLLGELADFACRLADAAREVTLGAWQGAGLSTNKGDAPAYDPVTATDVAAEQAMRALIRDAYPEHGILGEELGELHGAGGFIWSLDPIDGTRSFVCGLPTWTTLIALLRDGVPVIGVIDVPRLGERYIGHGARGWLDRDAALATSECESLAKARFSTTDPDLFAGPEREAFQRIRTGCRIVRYGHDAYAYARLAAGSIDLVVETGLKPYDLHALIPVVRGAGGVIGNWRGDADMSQGQVVAAATPALFAEAVALLAG